MSGAGRRGCGVGIRSAKEMNAFDRLPRAVRDRLNASPIRIAPAILLGDMRRGRWSVAHTMAFIATLEAAGRDALSAGATAPGDGNGLQRRS